jgi:ribosomal protein S27AE
MEEHQMFATFVCGKCGTERTFGAAPPEIDRRNPLLNCGSCGNGELGILTQHEYLRMSSSRLLGGLPEMPNQESN